MTDGPDQLARFVALSAVITGFREFELHGTGHAGEYMSTVVDTAGAGVLAELLDAWTHVSDEAGGGGDALQRALRRDVFSDPKLGPVARNIIRLWYIGVWYALPPAWMDAYGALERNSTFTVSPSAYTNGLVWTAIGGNPPGARGPGYGSWAGPPRFPSFPDDPAGP